MSELLSGLDEGAGSSRGSSATAACSVGSCWLTFSGDLPRSSRGISADPCPWLGSTPFISGAARSGWAHNLENQRPAAEAQAAKVSAEAAAHTHWTHSYSFLFQQSPEI